jgi:hypothetical protein
LTIDVKANAHFERITRCIDEHDREVRIRAAVPRRVERLEIERRSNSRSALGATKASAPEPSMRAARNRSTSRRTGSSPGSTRSSSAIAPPEASLARTIPIGA